MYMYVDMIACLELYVMFKTRALFCTFIYRQLRNRLHLKHAFGVWGHCDVFRHVYLPCMDL